LVEVALLDGGTLYADVRAYCRGCRLVLSPKLHGRVSVATADADTRMDAAILKSPQALNKPGTATTLGLLPWDDVVESCGASRILKSTLWTDYEAIRDRTMRVGRMRNLMKFSRAGKRVLESPFLVNPADAKVVPYVDIETINHFLDPKYNHRNDDSTRGTNHMRYWPLIEITGERPLEVWEVPDTDRHNSGRGPALLFLRPYAVGAAVRTHMVVVKKATGWVITAYVLGDTDPEEKRYGTLVYVGYTNARPL
jgi:hypothetical protein